MREDIRDGSRGCHKEKATDSWVCEMGLDGKNAVCPSAELLHNSWSRLMRCKLKKKKRNKYQYADGAAVKTSQKQAGVY